MASGRMKQSKPHHVFLARTNGPWPQAEHYASAKAQRRIIGIGNFKGWVTVGLSEPL
jgi:hypothetical protein